MSQFEIQIEGKIPWAGSLSCWRRKTSSKEITSYHIWLGVLFTLIFSYPYAVGRLPLSASVIFEWMSEMILAIFIFEDFFWNALHPSREFGFRVYLGKEKQYPAIGGIFLSFIPLDYILWTVLSSLLFKLSGGEALAWLEIVTTMVGLAIIIVPVMQEINKRTGAERRFDDFVNIHNFREVVRQGRYNQKKTIDLVDIFIKRIKSIS